MAFFTQAQSSSLYLASNTDSAGALAFVTSLEPSSSTPTLTLEQALTDSQLLGSFVFCRTALNFEDDKSLQDAFVASVRSLVARSPVSRGMLWLVNPTAIVEDQNIPYIGISISGENFASGMNNAYILPSLTLTIQSGMGLTLNGEILSITNGSIGFSGSSAPTMTNANLGTLPFSGGQRGCMIFSPYIQRQSLYSKWNWGFSFSYPQNSAYDGQISEWLPLASGTTDSTAQLGFVASIDLANPLNDPETLNANPNRSSLVFTGTNKDNTATSLLSYYCTISGNAVTLRPVGHAAATTDYQAAGLTFISAVRVSQEDQAFYTGPFGDFVVDAKCGPNGVTSELLCGFSGTEFMSVIPGATPDVGSRMRFTSKCAAYCPQFPPPMSSPTGPPMNNDPLLNTTYTTSWMQMLPPPNTTNTYCAQPQGSAMFGYDEYVWKNYNSLLGHMDTAYELPSVSAVSYPMVPYSGMVTSPDGNGISVDGSSEFETLIIGPTRRSQIALNNGNQKLSARLHGSGTSYLQAENSDDATTENITTPSGMIATVDVSGTSTGWKKILLGQVETPVQSELSFVKPTSDIQQAFQTNQLFMVAANNLNFVQTGGTFNNTINIGGWNIEADVGNSPAYGDYANVMIVKGVKGPLYDPDGDPQKNLISNPDKWTQKDEFSSPTTQNNEAPDASQMTNLSQWLVDYFTAANAQSDTDFFGNFVAMAKDENWTGIIVLRAKIATPPDDLAGITAGIRDSSNFYAHHLAVKISQIKSEPTGGGISINKQSSVFGLIYYEDHAYDPSMPGTPVTPAYGVPYDFITLTLKVLFENTAVKQFSSYTQLALGQIFGSAVTSMGPGGNNCYSVVMSGTFQNNNGKTTYGMKSLNDYSFLFNNNVLRKVEVISASMNTISTDSETTKVRFDLSGYIDFLLLQSATDETETIDLFSFGSAAGEQTPRSGLNYGALGLNMVFDTPDPVSSRVFTFDTSQISFNTLASTVRPGSLYSSLSLELQSLLTSEGTKGTPKSLGYLDVVTNVRLGGLSDDWNGLMFKLNLGTAGEMAGKVGLNAYLLLSWSPDSKATQYKASATLKMPGTADGASLISLQNVLTMSYGLIQILYTDKPGTTLHPTTLKPIEYKKKPNQEGQLSTANGKQFMVVLNEIAIKFLGLLKIPPNGSTAFYLFGDADKDQQADTQNTGLAWYAAYNKKASEQSKIQDDGGVQS